MEKKKMLLVVDPQIDFVSGSLPVPGAAEAMIALANYIRKHENTYAIRIVTADWHPYHHSSFKEEGGTWPRHCVQHSKGAALYTPILKALNEVRGGFTLLYKGDSIDKDEYSIMQNDNSAVLLGRLIMGLGIEQIDICGLACDVCVASTAHDLEEMLGKEMVNVLEEYAPRIES